MSKKIVGKTEVVEEVTEVVSVDQSTRPIKKQRTGSKEVFAEAVYGAMSEGQGESQAFVDSANLDVEAHYASGKQLYDSGHYPEAITQFTVVRLLAPTQAVGFYGLGKAYASLDQYQEAYNSVYYSNGACSNSGYVLL